MSDERFRMSAELIKDASQWGHDEPVLCLSSRDYGAMLPVSRLEFTRLESTFNKAKEIYDNGGRKREMLIGLLKKAGERERLQFLVEAVKAGEEVDIDEFLGIDWAKEDLKVILEFVLESANYFKGDDDGGT